MYIRKRYRPQTRPPISMSVRGRLGSVPFCDVHDLLPLHEIRSLGGAFSGAAFGGSPLTANKSAVTNATSSPADRTSLASNEIPGAGNKSEGGLVQDGGNGGNGRGTTTLNNTGDNGNHAGNGHRSGSREGREEDDSSSSAPRRDSNAVSTTAETTGKTDKIPDNLKVQERPSIFAGPAYRDIEWHDLAEDAFKGI